jgi:hypothetical protein
VILLVALLAADRRKPDRPHPLTDATAARS